MPPLPFTRRSAFVASVLALVVRPVGLRAQTSTHPNARWLEAAESMRQLALSGGDQNYGAAVVLAGAVLYSTSRPCPACEEAAARARVARMYFGSVLQDAGEPGRGAR